MHSEHMKNIQNDGWRLEQVALRRCVVAALHRRIFSWASVQRNTVAAYNGVRLQRHWGAGSKAQGYSGTGIEGYTDAKTGIQWYRDTDAKMHKEELLAELGITAAAGHEGDY